MIPTKIKAHIKWSLPAQWSDTKESAWADSNMRGHRLGSFLEGPSFDRAGNLYVVDVPFGRIFRISPEGDWTLRAHYDGLPNGLKVHKDGSIRIADYRRGILQLTETASVPEPLVSDFLSEGFLGCNDLFFDSTGALWFTDQGQTGLHNPAGRVFRRDPNGGLACVLSGIPSPNGLVMNQAETQLYVAVTRANAVWRLPLMKDGTTTKVGVFLQLSGGHVGPDGLALDADGGLVVAHPGMGIRRFDKVGRETHYVECSDGAMWTNMAFGGSSGDELHIVDSSSGSIHIAQMPYAGQCMFSHAN